MVPEEKTWERNAPSQIALNSIFAALDAALIVIVIQDPQPPTAPQFLTLVLLVMSFFLFAISAEKGVVALDEHDVRKYAYYMLPYNLGVICGGIAVEVLTYARFDVKIETWITPHFGMSSRCVSGLAWLIIGVVLLWTWLHDAFWMLFCTQEEFQEWLDELQDLRRPKQDHRTMVKLFYWLREQLHG